MDALARQLRRFAVLALFPVLLGLPAGCAGSLDASAAAELPKLESPIHFVSSGARPEYRFTIPPDRLASISRTIPDELMVYSVVREPLTAETVCELAERVGVSVLPEIRATMPEMIAQESGDDDPGASYDISVIGELTSNVMIQESTLDPDDPFVSYVSSWVEADVAGENRVVLNIWIADSGRFSISVRGARLDPADGAVTEEQALRIAETFVQRTGLLPEGVELGGVSRSDWVTASRPDGEGLEDRTIARQVTYQRYLDGYPAGQLRVTVNGRGEVYRVEQSARNLTPLAAYPILSPEEAIAAIEAGGGSLSGPGAPEAGIEATVENIRLHYEQGALRSRDETVQPCYRIEGSVSGYDEPFKASLPAVRPEYLLDE